MGDKYKLKVIEPFSEMSGDSLFNKFQREGNHQLLQALTNMQQVAETVICPIQVKPVMIKALEEFDPDLVISVFPVANSMTWEILKEQGEIPMLVLVTDLECRHFFNNMKEPGPRFKVALAFDDEGLKEPLRDKFNDENFVITGYPLRPDFGVSAVEQAEQIQAIEEELGIGKDDAVVLIMMGAQGVGDAVAHRARQIATSTNEFGKKVHVIALCGSNQELQQKTEAVKNISTNPDVNIVALGRKDGAYIAALMRRGNAIITKPGGSSTNEAIAEEIYSLFHSEGVKAVRWEEGNMLYSINKQWGEEIEEDHFVEQVAAAIARPRLVIKECPGRAFDQNLQAIVQHMLHNYPMVPPASMIEKKELIQTQQRLLEGAGTFSDKIIFALAYRETKEAIENLFTHPAMKPVLRHLLFGESIDEVNPVFAGTVAKLLCSNEIEDSLLDIAFTVHHKSTPHQLENKFIKYIVKKHKEHCMKVAANYIPLAIVQYMREESIEYLVQFCKDSGKDENESRNIVQAFVERIRSEIPAAMLT